MEPEPPSLLLSILLSLDFSFFLGLGLLLFLLLCSALISGAEVAFFSLVKSDFDSDIDEKIKAYDAIEKLLDRPKKLLATILVANNFINIAVVILFAYLGETMFADIDIAWVRFLLEVIVVTFLILMFGEIIPKIYASRNRVKFSVFMVTPLRILDVLFSPISLPMRSVTLSIHNKLGKQKSNLSVDQLSQALELTNDSDATFDEHKILQGIVSFGNTDTKQVMRPRVDMFAINQEDKYSDILPEIISKGYSRIPVFKDNIDKITGVLYVKDLLPFIDRKQFDWTTLLREPFFVPENKKLDDLMVEFQEKKVHLAVVVNEYGGTSGLVSLEDVIEEIVGDISDEFDDDDVNFVKIDDKNYSFEGKTTLKQFYKITDLEDESEFENHKGEAETIAGFILEISGFFPKRQSKINFKNYVFTIETIDKKRIKQIKFTVLD